MRILADYEGRAIRLTDERLQHIVEHPEMRGMEDRIEETLRSPERVLESLSTRVGDKHLCVVVKVAENDAFVLTAYLMARPAGGRQLWPKSD